MSLSDKNAETIYENLKWLNLKSENESEFERLKSRGISGVLASVGFAVTVGILANGLYYMYKRNSRKQQLFMRYRILAQGLTVAVMGLGTLGMRSS